MPSSSTDRVTLSPSWTSSPASGVRHVRRYPGGSDHPGARRAVKSVIEADGVLGELLVQTMFRRRQALLLLRSGLQLVGSHYSPDTQRLREFAARNRLAYSWIDLDSDPVGPALLRTLRLEVRDTPVALLGGGSVLVNPSNAGFATAADIAAWARAQAQHRVTMLDALRDRRGLTGTKKGCDQDACGAWPEPESVNGVVS